MGETCMLCGRTRRADANVLGHVLCRHCTARLTRQKPGTARQRRLLRRMRPLSQRILAASQG